MNAEDLVLNFKKDISSLSRTERRRAIESVRCSYSFVNRRGYSR